MGCSSKGLSFNMVREFRPVVHCRPNRGSGQRRYLKPIGQAIRRECCTNSFENGPAAEMSRSLLKKANRVLPSWQVILL